PADTPLEFQVTVKCKNGDTAKSINAVVTDAVREARRRQMPPDVAEMLDEMKIEVHDTKVVARLLVRTSLLIEPLRASKWERPEFCVANLTDKSEDNRRQATDRLLANPQRALPALGEALRKGDFKTRTAVLALLAGINPAPVKMAKDVSVLL